MFLINSNTQNIEERDSFQAFNSQSNTSNDTVNYQDPFKDIVLISPSSAVIPDFEEITSNDEDDIVIDPVLSFKECMLLVLCLVPYIGCFCILIALSIWCYHKKGEFSLTKYNSIEKINYFFLFCLFHLRLSECLQQR